MKPVSLLLMMLALCCGSSEQDRDAARARFEAALAAQDPAAALTAIAELRDGLPETPEATLELVQLLVRAGETNRALWLLEAARQRHPERNDLRLALAETALGVGDPARAIAALADISAEDGDDHAYALLLHAKAELALGDLEGSLATLERAEALYPGRFQYRMARIQTLASEQRFDQALELVDQARSQDGLGETQRVWLDRAEAGMLEAKGETAAALRALEALTEANPADVEAWARRTAILLAALRADEACAALERALVARPKVGELYELLASARLARGDAQAAEAALRERVERVPDASAVEDLVEFLYQAERSADAAALLEDFLDGFSGEGSVELEYLQVAMLLSAGDGAAEKRFEEFTRRHPRDPRSEYLRARFEIARGDAASAAERLKQVVSRLDRSDVHHWLAVALEMLGDNDGAEYRYGIALQRNPDQISSYPGLLRALERRGAWEAVVKHSENLLQRSPDSAAGFDSLTRALMLLGAPEKAEGVLRTYVDRYPDALAPTLALSQALRIQGRSEAALALLEAAAPRFEREPELLAERAIALGQSGRAEAGLALLEQAAGGGEHAALHRARAFLFLSAGDGPAGLAEIERALALDPANPIPLRLSGDYHSGRGDFAAATRAYERFLELRPGDAEVWFRLGVARDRAGDVEGCIAAYRKAAALDMQAAAPRNNLAMVLEREERLDEALAMAQAAFARAESNPAVMDTLGWLYLRAGRVERAVALLEKARALEPEAAHARYHLAVAYLESGRTGEARELLSELNENLEPGHELRSRVDEAIAPLR